MRFQYTDLAHGANLLASGEGTHDRLALGVTPTITSQIVYISYFTAQKTEVVTNVTTYTGSTAAAAGATFCKVGVYGVNNDAGDMNQIWTTANDTSMWTATNTAYTKPILNSNNTGAPAMWNKIRGLRYGLLVMCISSGAMPNFVGINIGTQTPFSTICGKQPPVFNAYTTGPPTNFPIDPLGSSFNTTISPRIIYAEFT
jgi:hypothetical protein